MFSTFSVRPVKNLRFNIVIDSSEDEIDDTDFRGYLLSDIKEKKTPECRRRLRYESEKKANGGNVPSVNRSGRPKRCAAPSDLKESDLKSKKRRT